MGRAAMLLGLACLVVHGCRQQAGPGGAPAAATGPAVRVDPARAKELYEQGLKVQRAGDVAAAIKLYHQAIATDPDCAEALNHFAWLRATNRDPKLRNGDEAVAMAERACKVAVVPGRPSIFAANCLDTLAAACAEAGQFDRAVTVAKQAVAMAGDLSRPEAASDFSARLRLFEEKEPFRE